MIIERAKLSEVIAAATAMANNGKDRDTGAEPHVVMPGTATSSHCVFNVSDTCNYPGSRLKYLHTQQNFISKRAHFVSCDFRALPSVIKLW